MLHVQVPGACNDAAVFCPADSGSALSITGRGSILGFSSIRSDGGGTGRGGPPII